ncbi:MAG: copper resistance protein CopC [Candidatus Kerfeldbacteria bacterium]|nr:copper resistance protein CopC [Candidatus Kerfeldbacteria bacterium]
MTRNIHSVWLFGLVATGLIGVAALLFRLFQPSTLTSGNASTASQVVQDIGSVTTFTEVRTNTFLASTPRNNALLAVAPNTVSVSFSETLAPGSSVSVTNADGQFFHLGQPTFSDDRLIMTVLLARHANRSLTVNYHACALDGECADGSFGFVVRPITP